MTTTSQTAKPTCPPSAVHDQILPWSDVRDGDLIVWDGEFRLVVGISPMDSGNDAMVFDAEHPGGIIPCGTYAAVRRYDTEPQ
jgi:hypothetical protein